jgi:hypothetical protein
MGHEVFDRLIFRCFPGAGDRKDKAPPACCISLIPILDHAHVGLGAIGGITLNDLIRRMAFQSNQTKSYWEAKDIPIDDQ